MTKIQISVTSDAEIIAMALHTLGYVPENSVVIFTTFPDGRVGATFRVDMPKDAHTVAECVLQGTEMFNHHGLTIAWYMIFVPEDHDLPEDLLDRLILGLTMGGLDIRGGFRIDQNGWKSIDGISAANAPIRPLVEIFESPLARTMTANGYPLSTKQTALDPTLEITTEDFHETVTADGNRAINQVLNDVATLGTGRVIPTKRKMLLCHELRMPLIRDKAIYELLGKTNEAIEATFNRILTTRMPTEEAECMRRFALDLLKYAPRKYRASLHTILGIIEWNQGRSTLGQAHTQLALADSPGYKLAELLTKVI